MLGEVAGPEHELLTVGTVDFDKGVDPDALGAALRTSLMARRFVDPDGRHKRDACGRFSNQRRSCVGFMDVRCEKCQTEYELDEARLKPGGVTVKCTNCGHMFKIRKRAITNVGVPAVRTRQPPSGRPIARARRAGEPRSSARTRSSTSVTRQLATDELPTDVERQWLIRLENGEQKSCRELATLQQWIVAGVVTRESLISRTGKTWKRLGDISRARAVLRDRRRGARAARRAPDRSRPGAPVVNDAGTMLGLHGAAGRRRDDPARRRRREPHDADPARSRAQRRQPRAADGLERRDAAGGRAAAPSRHPVPAGLAATQPARRPITTPPPPPAKRTATPSSPAPVARRRGDAGAVIAVPQGNRATAAWATDGMSSAAGGQTADGPVGSVRRQARRDRRRAGVRRPRARGARRRDRRSTPARSAWSTTTTTCCRRAAARAPGCGCSCMALLVMGAAAGVVYVFVIKKRPRRHGGERAGKDAACRRGRDAAMPRRSSRRCRRGAGAGADARRARARRARRRRRAPAARRDRRRSTARTTRPSQAMRAHLIAQLAQDLLDRAGARRRQDRGREAAQGVAKQLVLDAATAAQRAFKAAARRCRREPRDGRGAAAAGQAGEGHQALPRHRHARRPTRTGRATSRSPRRWSLARDGKLDDATAAFAAIDSGDGKLETVGRRPRAVPPRARARRAEQARRRQAAGRRDPRGAARARRRQGARGAGSRPRSRRPIRCRPRSTDGRSTAGPTEAGAGTGRAPSRRSTNGRRRRVATTTSCSRRRTRSPRATARKAMELYAKALEQKPNGVEALTGMGYCHIDAKQFSSAFSKFRAALAVSPRYEPALCGHRRGVPAAGPQGAGDRGVQGVPRGVSRTAPKAKKALERLGVTRVAGAGGPRRRRRRPPTPAPTPPPRRANPPPARACRVPGSRSQCI